MNPLTSLTNLYRQHEKSVIDNFFRFLRFKSISAEPEFAPEVRACADWLATYLREAGLKTEIWPSAGHPVIFAEWLEAGRGKPTVMIYNHYDVQPVDPLDLWTSPPFEPVIRNGEVYARGAQDNKGQCFYVVSAIKALLHEHCRLPVNVKLLIEGEEEMGSANLAPVLAQHKDRLRADHLFIVDTGFHSLERPAVTLGTRGLVTMTAEFTGSNTDLHSGSHGGIVYNPNRALVEALAGARDQNGRITIPGFYDDMRESSAAELEAIDFEFDEAEYTRQFAAKPNGGEQGRKPTMAAWIQPTFEINGIHGGYTGSGFKTVIPAKCFAKISCRLVPDQDPLKIGALVKKYLISAVPEGIKVDVTIHPGVGRAVRTGPFAPAVQAAAKAMSEIFDRDCKFILDGASIPIVPELAAVANAEVVLMGYGLPGDQIHAPNEHFGVDRIQKGFLTIGRTLEILAE